MASGTSLNGLGATLEGLHDFYCGCGAEGVGVDAYVRHINPALADRMEAQFKATAAAINAVEVPLEEALVSRRQAVEAAQAECEKLEHLCQTDLMSALGLTVLADDYDGD